MTTASVIIMDSYPIIRMSLEMLLREIDDIDVVLKTDESRLTIGYLREKPVDLVITDIDLPGTDGLSLLKKIKKTQKETKVLFLSSKPEEFYAMRALQEGASGFISKDKEEKEILNAVNALLSGYLFFSSNLTAALTQTSGKRDAQSIQRDTPLSNREVMVTRLLLKGLSNKKIGEQLALSNKTISAHKYNIFQKLNISSIFELMDYAKEKKLI
ncbi:fimbria biosynthesis transcriptional regulator FimZ [Enterobacter sp. Ap-1006]|uniref:fimbria biosynthesis transcriptional regulator FimZ n=1 Tax=Enterobacter sp. Ap-1006 TaxID=2608345 RepID=UPI001424971E|nr:fimbria biosynthesis transcriptional regulator FimZ [Enterobacter sp. Ap-1006]NIF48657.1 fimbria biosynthesis transcriptional regulator FimZ [Enterobacter sp. Ap-1006]